MGIRFRPGGCEIEGCATGCGEVVVEKHGQTRVVCPSCIDEMVVLWGWSFTRVLDRLYQMASVA